MQKVDGISEQLDFFRHFSVKDKKYPVQFKTVRDILRQHRAIVSASRSRLFAPHLQFEKREIHTVFLRFPNFELSQKSRLGLLAKLCGVALTFFLCKLRLWFQNIVEHISSLLLCR